jgi:hypothetical protein
MSPIGTGWPNGWQTVVDHYLPGVAEGDHGSNGRFVAEPVGLAGTLSVAL